MKIGILAVQGAFIEHEKMLSKLGTSYFEIRQLKDIATSFDGLILPGGESTVMGKLLHELHLFSPLKEAIENGLPVFGTCAGLILLSQNLTNNPTTYFGTLPVSTKRNAYGRQLGSFQTVSHFTGLGKIPMTFIRAPYIEEVSNHVTPLATIDDHIVAVQYKKQLATAFHPELTDNPAVHEYFLKLL